MIKKTVFVLIFQLVTACNSERDFPAMPTFIVTFKVGESGASFQSRNSSTGKRKVDKQPAGINFHKIHWDSNELAVVKVEHGAYSFDIQFAELFQGAEDQERLSEGVSRVYIASGLSAESKIAHDESRLKFMSIVQNLQKLGWKHYNPYICPRLKGAQAVMYALEDWYCSFPPDIVPSLEQWMRIDRGFWRLHADGVFLEITFDRDRNLMNPNELGAYLLNFTLIDKNRFVRQNFEHERRDHWQDYWVEYIKDSKKRRYSEEAELIRRGFVIDNQYQDPYVHPADPVEP